MATLVAERWSGRWEGSSAPKSSAVPDLSVRVVWWGISRRSSDSAGRVCVVMVMVGLGLLAC